MVHSLKRLQQITYVVKKGASKIEKPSLPLNLSRSLPLACMHHKSSPHKWRNPRSTESIAGMILGSRISKSWPAILRLRCQPPVAYVNIAEYLLAVWPVAMLRLAGRKYSAARDLPADLDAMKELKQEYTNDFLPPTLRGLWERREGCLESGKGMGRCCCLWNSKAHRVGGN